MSEAKPRTLNWKAILVGLAQLQSDSPQILQRNVLVGGAACMFYRDQLKRINDPDFQVRAYSAEEENVWLSHDADFATTEPEQIPDGVGGVPLGRLQMGFVLGADEFLENARNVEISWEGGAFKMLIADPLDLWREKEAATYRRNRPQDALHLEVLETTLQWETAYSAEKVATGDIPSTQWISRVEEIRRRWNSILTNQKLRARLLALNVSEITEFAVNSQ